MVKTNGVKRLSLRRNISWASVGVVMYAISQWLMLTVLLRFGSPEAAGQFGLGLAVSSPIIIFSQLSLHQIQATDAQFEYDFFDYLRLRLLMTVIAMILIGMVGAISDYNTQTYIVIMFVAGSKAFESISDVIYGLFQQVERLDLAAQSRLLKGPLSVLTMGITFGLTGNVAWATFALMLTSAGVAVIFDLPRTLFILHQLSQKQGDIHSSTYLLSNLRPSSWNFSILLHLIWIALPLGLVRMMGSLNTNIPRYMIESNFGEAALGIFVSLAYIVVLGSTINQSVSQAVIPRLAIYYAERRYNSYVRLLGRLVGLGAGVGLLGVVLAWMVGEQIITLLYGAAYAEYNDTLLWVIIAAWAGYISAGLGQGLMATRRFAVQLPMMLSVVLSTFAASMFLIPAWGLNGAAITLALSKVIQSLLTLGIIVLALRSR